ncbi:hypothetical protein QFC21_003372 [Naganishia friedmannii]|uniref:Uncharacterized protein n=1 Tax=Naganishia friedmannii TaxID=89922 RepID=A0ACC2VP22_9TREE|nr:hypothetical protein QFC21_003372 [Naganishia friedmannii]
MKTPPHSSDYVQPESLRSTTPADPGHLPSTYTALLVLGILRAPSQEWVDKLDVDGLERFLCTCADVNGSFSPIPLARTASNSDSSSPASHTPLSPPFQSDARMSYCAAIIHDFTTFAKYPRSREPTSYAPLKPPTRPDEQRNMARTTSVSTLEDRRLDARWQKRTREWLSNCQTWEGGFAQHPGLEAQCGTTYCAITSLALLYGYTAEDNWRSRVDLDGATRYLVSRQLEGNTKDAYNNTGEVDAGVGGGFQGRPGKDEDVCYSFWCGAAMRVLHGKALFDMEANTRALLDSQSPMGGFGKAQGDYPDPYHSYLALAALSMNEHEPKSVNTTITESTETNTGASIATEVAAEQPRLPSLGLKALDPQWNVAMDTRAYIRGCLGDIFTRRYANQNVSAT